MSRGAVPSRPRPGAVARARRHVDDVEFSAEDATRSDPDYLCAVVSAVIEAGATTVNLPDTVGYSTPDEIYRFFSGDPRARAGLGPRRLLGALPQRPRPRRREQPRGARGGLPAARVHRERNRRARGQRVARGDRHDAPRAARQAAVHDGHRAASRSTPRASSSRKITGEAVQANKAIVGRNAFAHEAGIHQDGILKDRRTYEIMRPEDVGVPRTTMVLGKHSGRHALKARCEALGIVPARHELDDLYRRMIALADRQKVVHDRDLVSLWSALKRVVALRPAHHKRKRQRQRRAPRRRAAGRRGVPGRRGSRATGTGSEWGSARASRSCRATASGRRSRRRPSPS